MTTTIDTSKNPVFLGSWLTAEPTNGADAWPAWGVFNGARDAVETYAAEAGRIRATSDFNDYANPALKKQAAIQSFAKTLLSGRTARYQELLDRVAATIATNERELTKGGPAVNDTRQAAIWDYLSGLDNDDVQRKIREAIAVSDRETVSAVLGAPNCFGFIPNADQRTKYADAFLRMSNPDAYGALVDLKTALAVAQGGWERAQSYIRADARLAAFESTGA
jgi:hypothetical protein